MLWLVKGRLLALKLPTAALRLPYLSLRLFCEGKSRTFYRLRVTLLPTSARISARGVGSKHERKKSHTLPDKTSGLLILED